MSMINFIINFFAIIGLIILISYFISYIIEYFKEQKLRESKCHFIIVKDMLLTGFDAPICQVMYLDRKIMDHGLLQAIARVNRPKEGKQRFGRREWEKKEKTFIFNAHFNDN